jgi:cellulose synthase/poly-beta-1,6-N-acetylglucosamine synthase-like glycosyltransferase
MTTLIATLLILALAVALLPVLVLLTQALLAWTPAGAAPVLSGERPRLAILIPAHNEEAGIAAVIAALLPQLQPGDRVLVVADNCSDATAAVARQAGAEVRERSDKERRGKGYALDFGVRCLAGAFATPDAPALPPPEVMLIVDADCLVAPGAIDRLARTAQASGRPVQALYLMHAPASAGPMKKIAEFAWIVKNRVRPLGFYRLGLPCQLMGTGMAFPWATISAASLANGHIVEDMKLGMDLARAGKAPLFCPHALVTSTFPSSDAGTSSQRARWEHGHMSMLSAAPRLLFGGLVKMNRGMIGLALDLCVPPLALLTLIVLALFVCSALLALAGALVPLALASLALIALGLAIMLSWWRYGRQVLSAGNLLMTVMYIFWKVPLYLRFFINRQVEWVRSKRDSE